MQMIIDECVSPRLVPLLWQEGHDVIHVRDRGMLSTDDHVVWHFACSENRTVCTINGVDFRKLAARTSAHPGVLVLPSGHNPTSQFNLVWRAIDWVTNSNTATGFGNQYIEIGDRGEIICADFVCAEVIGRC